MALARLAQRAENDYVGVACGLMDQFASANGRPGAALLLDSRSLEWRAIRLPLDDHALVVCHTGSERRLGVSAYNERRRQCEEAVAALRSRYPAVASLRDVDRGMLDKAGDLLDPVPARRARHVVAENARCSRPSRRSRPATLQRSAGCGRRATHRFGTCTRSAHPSSTRSSRSRPECAASWPPG